MKTIFSALLFLFFVSNFFAQEFELVKIPRPKSAIYPFSQVEPSIAIHPRCSKKMIAGTVMNDYYYSKNGGKSWESTSIKTKFGVNGDPVVHIDKKGRYYYFHLSDPTEGQWLDRIVCDYSKRIKGKWKTSATTPNAPKAQDKQWVAECPKTGDLYLTWTQFDEYESHHPKDSSRIMFSKSTDRGEHWSTPKVISALNGDCLDGDNTVEGAVPTVNEDGVIYVVWTGPHGIRFNKSKDGGETWFEVEKKITDHPGGWAFDVPGISRCNGLPIVQVDHSGGKYNGRIYVNWADQRNGVDDTDVWLIYSDDEGKTWSEEITVNQDDSNKHQFFTWMNIDQKDGSVYFVYYDRRKYEDNRTDVYLAYSKDGCKTLKETKLSKTPFVPNANIFFGDYINIAANKGVVRPIWSRMEEGNISLWTALVDGKVLK
ncbi:MAG: sialidase family protein [Brumimicrobium sp.]